VDDTSNFERAIFNWFSKHGYRAAAIAPVAVFLAFLIAGTAAVMRVSARPFDAYVAWIIAVAILAGMALYLTEIYSLSGLLFGTRRFKLLELHQTMRDIREMGWKEFEQLVVAYYEQRGFDVEHTGRDRADGGVDLIARKDRKTWLVQCKHWREDRVSVRPLRELLGLVTHHRADYGVLVAAGTFEEDALAFVKTSPEIVLVGGEELRSLVEEAVRGKHEPDVVCPKCGGAMHRKPGRYGIFLSCVNYPACKGARDLPAA
jgi:restriction system protein